MTDDGSMTGRPYGGTNERPDDAPLPGERPEPGQVGADPAQEPRAAQGPMSDDVTTTPGNAAGDDDAGGAHAAEGSAKAPDMPDATGPTG